MFPSCQQKVELLLYIFKQKTHFFGFFETEKERGQFYFQASNWFCAFPLSHPICMILSDILCVVILIYQNINLFWDSKFPKLILCFSSFPPNLHDIVCPPVFTVRNKEAEFIFRKCVKINIFRFHVDRLVHDELQS